MKKIKIFIASSRELHLERLEITDLLQQLNDYLDRRGIVLQPVKWEYLDSSMGIGRKQDEYNKKLCECEICLVLYWTKLGEYTTEELDTAYNELRLGNNPKKLYVYFKDADASQIMPELQAFRDNFLTKYGHFYFVFQNVDTMRLNFLLQLEAYLSSTEDSKILQISNGCVGFEDNVLVSLENVPFAGNNPQYLKLLKDIEKQKNRLSKNPNDEEEQQELVNLEKELTDLGNNLLDTARWITMLSNETSSKRLQEAIRLFENGDNKGAEAILNLKDISNDIDRHCLLIDRSVAHIKKEQQLIVKAQEGLKNNIEEGRLRIKMLENEKEEDYRLKIAQTYETILEKVKGYVTDSDYTSFAMECRDYVWELAAIGLLYRKLTDPSMSIVIYEHIVKCFSILSERDSSVLPEFACSEELLADLYLHQNERQKADKLMKDASALFRKIREQDPNFAKNSIEECFRLSNIDTPEPLQRLLRLQIMCLGIGKEEAFNCHKEEIVATAEECIQILPEYRMLCKMDPLNFGDIYISLLDNAATALYNDNQYDKAVTLWEEELTYQKNKGTSYQIISTSHYLGLALYYSDQDDKAEAILLDAVNLAEGEDVATGIITEKIECETALSMIYKDKNKNQEVISCLTKAIDLSERLKTEEHFLLGYWVGKTHEELADFFYYTVDDNEQAAKHYGEAVRGYEWQLKKDKNSKNYYVRILTNALLLQGHSLFLSDHEEESIITYKKALSYYNDPDISSELWWREARTNYRLCEVLKYQDMYNEAKKYLTKALIIYKNHSEFMTEEYLEHYEKAKEMQKKLRGK